VRQGNLARHAESVWAQTADAPPLSASDYAFLLERFVDRATLHRAEALAKKWGVLPHAVMIANGWLSASDYYRALAQACAVPFRSELGSHEVTAPASLRSPRECLARGLLKECARGGGYVFAPEKLRPNAVEEVLTRLEPHRLSLASPDTLRQAACGHLRETSRRLPSMASMRAFRTGAPRQGSHSGSACCSSRSSRALGLRSSSTRSPPSARFRLRSFSFSCR
jgi:hypothetical protein